MISKKIISLALAAAVSFSAAHATTLRFDGKDGRGLAFDTPTNTGNVVGCNSFGANGRDLCSRDHAAGFNYSKGVFSFNVKGLKYDSLGSAVAAEVIQDLIGKNQGLGVITPGENRFKQDQVTGASGESILFSFGQAVTLYNIVFNDGTGNDCPGGGTEGPCGDVGVKIDGGVLQVFTAFIAGGILSADGSAVLALTGQVFEFFALTSGAGFSIEEFSIVPIPGALPLLLSGLAGLGFASSWRKKKAR